MDDLEARLRTVGSPPLDILIRTSGVKRLSDYMLWQVRIPLLDLLFSWANYRARSAPTTRRYSSRTSTGPTLVFGTSYPSSSTTRGKSGQPRLELDFALIFSLLAVLDILA